MALLARIDESLNGALGKIRLAEPFERHHIPPIALPIAVLILIVVLVLLLSAPGAPPQPEETCGDGVCANSENATSCRADCFVQPKTRSVLVRIISDIVISVELRLESSQGTLIKADSGKLTELSVKDVKSGSVRAVVKNPANGKTAASEIVELAEDLTTIELAPPPSFYATTTPPPPPPPQKATLKVVLTDADSGDQIGGKVTIVIPNGQSYVPTQSREVVGSSSFTVDSGKWYAVLVEAPEYEPYNGMQSQVSLEPGMEKTVTVQMYRMFGGPAKLSVCVRDQYGKAVANGSAVLKDSGGARAGSADLGLSGCASLDTTKGALVTVSTSGLPADCAGSASQLMAVDASSMGVNLSVRCGGTSLVRAKVLAGGEVAANATVTAWYRGDSPVPAPGPKNSLPPGSGGYTGYATIRPGADFYLMASGVEGYYDKKTSYFTLGPFENKSVDIVLKKIPPPEPNITIQGITVPSPAAAGEIFPVKISKVLYGTSSLDVKDVTSLANITVSIAGSPCEVSGSAARCLAPDLPGEHDLLVTALYNGKQGIQVVKVRVAVRGANLFDITPHPMMDTESPVDLGFDIQFNDSPLDSLAANSVSVYYEDGGLQVASGLKLSGSNGTYFVAVNTPFPGEHRADLYLKKVVGDSLYEENFSTTFNMQPSSLKLDEETLIVPYVLEPLEDYVPYLKLRNAGKEVSGLSNIVFVAYSHDYPLTWDSRTHAYASTLTAPSPEGIYPVEFEIGYQSVAQDTIYVIDTSKALSDACEITKCEDLPDIRTCVKEHKDQKYHTEKEVIACIKQGWSGGGCASGDVNQDKVLDDEDTAYMSDLINAIQKDGVVPEGTDTECADANEDGFITKEDLSCLQGLLSGAYTSPKGCPDCDPSEAEICNDGVDNDCDGQIDKDNYNEDEEESYPANLCACSASTPCTMLRDADGIASTQEYQYCISISWQDSGKWTWVGSATRKWLRDDSNCDQSINCGWWRCGSTKYVCSRGTATKWYATAGNQSSMNGVECGTVTSPSAGTGSVADCCTEGCPAGMVNCDCSAHCGTPGYSCNVCGGGEYAVYYGPYGSDLPCEGSAYYTASKSYCGDGWDNNCDGTQSACSYY